MKAIFLYTDFGLRGPYIGQMKAVLHERAPDLPVIDLMHDAPRFDTRRAAYLLAAVSEPLPDDAVICAVVDPAVGSSRPALALAADNRWFVGPGGGLLDIVARRCQSQRWYRLPTGGGLSASFHGRDLFVPAAAALATGTAELQSMAELPELRDDWPDDLSEVIYVDAFGNLMTGLRAASIPAASWLKAGGRRIPPFRTFSDVDPGEPLWYANSQGLAEIAVNQGRADQLLGLEIGSAVEVSAS